MKFSMLLATLGTREEELIRLFDSLKNQTYKNFELIAVTQGNHEKISNILSNYDFEYKHIPMEGKGISRARNKGIPYVSGDVITFTDDDCWYESNALEVVKDHFEKLPMEGKGISRARNKGIPYVSGDVITFTDDDCWYESNALEVVKDHFEKYDADVLTFKHMDPHKNEYTKVYPDNEVINFPKMDTLKQISFDIYVNTNRVPAFKDGFDERFGVGSIYNSGEENIYLMDLYNKGYKKMCFFPIIIAYHPKKVNFPKMDTLKQISFDIYVNTNRVPAFKDGFDERFGVGSIYNSGEENIYLMDLYNKGYKKMCFFPIIIAYHPKKECNYLDERSFIGKGPLFKRLFGESLGLPMLIAFGMKKKKLIDKFEPGRFWSIYKAAIKECIQFRL